MKVSMIAAVAENGVIGRDNDLPWRLRDDMRFFVKTTRGHAVIMGRLNYQSMGKPLPKRRNIVVSRSPDFSAEGCECVTSVERALQLAEEGGETEAFIIGGAQIYRVAFPYCHCFYRTRVIAPVEGDVVFPELDYSGFSTYVLDAHEADDENEHAFVIERMERRGEPASFRGDPR
jgi:dihydrofolate reductase